MRFRRPAFLIALLMTIWLPLWSQYHFIFGFGHSFVGEDLWDGRNYALYLTSAGISREMLKLNSDADLLFLTDIHFGLVHTQPDTLDAIDVAWNAAAGLDWKPLKNLSIQFSAGSGPAWQSSVSPKQRKGFVFSNNFTLGVRCRILRGLMEINPQIRFRHMSNGGLFLPNSGIDNFFLLLGLSVPLD